MLAKVFGKWKGPLELSSAAHRMESQVPAPFLCVKACKDSVDVKHESNIEKATK